MLITDRDGQVFEITLRGSYAQSIRTEARLKEVLDNSTSVPTLLKRYRSYSAEAAERLSNAYAGKTYMAIMRDFGMLSQSKRLEGK